MLGERARAKVLAAAAAMGVGVLAAGAAAASGPPPVDPNYIFPDGAAGFALASHGGPIDPGVLVGFNPQPDPPGDAPTTLNLGNPERPTLFNGATGPFTLEFTLTGLGAFTLPTPDAPNTDGVTGLHLTADGHTIDVGFSIPGVTPGSWVGFNPQPDPPGDASFGVDMSFPGDPLAGFVITIDDNAVLNYTLAGAPEPAAWAMMLLGFGGLGAALRARRRTALA